jgi:hypothetical protein
MTEAQLVDTFGWLSLVTVVVALLWVGRLLVEARSKLGSWRTPKEQTRINIDYKHLDSRRAWSAMLAGGADVADRTPPRLFPVRAEDVARLARVSEELA